MRLSGQRCRVAVREKRSLFRRSIREIELKHLSEEGSEERLSFLATRWVEAWSCEDAGERARDAVASELGPYLRNSIDEPIDIHVEQVEESDARTAAEASNRGFTWYSP